MNDLTIVIPFHGEVELLLPLLRSLDAQTARDLPPIIVSDDASVVPLEKALAGFTFNRFTPVIVRNDRNGGPGAARNRGLSVVDTPWVAFLDGDTVAARDWLENLSEDIARDDADVIEGATEMSVTEPVTPFTHSTEAAPPDRHVAGNVAFRTSVLRAAGGFDERFFDPERKLHFREDAEVTFRLQASGARFHYDERLLVEHPPLPSSFWSPIRLARRYHFDPLLSREHPDRFRQMNAARFIGPVTLRRARHDAAMGFAASLVVIAAGALGGRSAVRRIGVAGLLVSWAANVVALCWRRTVQPRQLAMVVAAAALIPFSYLWHYWRGVVRFGHRPRL